MKAEHVIHKGISGIQYLFGKQVAGRLIPFVLNTLMVNILATSVIGVANVHLQLILNIISILTRECLRRACLKYDSEAPELSGWNSNVSLMKLINMSWLVVPFGVVTSTLVTLAFLWNISDEQKAVSYFSEAVALTGLACFLEMLSEPPYILAQNLFLYQLRMIIETVGILVRCIVTYICVAFFQLELLSFGIGHVVYSICLIVGYYGYFISNVNGTYKNFNRIRQLFPHKIVGHGYFDSSTITLALNFEWQSLQKLVLQEGEKIVLAYSASLYNQGIYSVVNNLGSLVARFVFQTVEEVAFSIFSKLLTPSSQQSIISTNDKITGFNFLMVLLKLMTYIGLYFITFGPAFSYLLLHILYGSAYSLSDAPTVLSTYFFYVEFMGINGITEAFVHAVASQKHLSILNVLMIIVALVYMSVATLLVNVSGTIGLVIANCFNMLFRIITHGYYIYQYIQGVPTSTKKISPIPAIPVLISCGVFLLLTNFSASTFCNASIPSQFHWGSFSTAFARVFPAYCFYHVLVGVICVLTLSFEIYFFEKQFLQELIKLWKSKAA